MQNTVKRASPLTPKEVAVRLRCRVETVYAEIRRGRLAAFRVGRGWRIERAEFERYVRPEGRFN